MKSKPPETIYGNAIPGAQQFRGKFLKRLYSAVCAGKRHTSPLLTAEKDMYGYGPFRIRLITERRAQDGKISDPRGIILGTIRMGFGHARMAIALASAAHHAGLHPYWFDLVNFADTAASATIRSLEGWYNRASRISQLSKWFNNTIWEKITSVQGQYLAVSYQNKCLAELFSPVLADLPADMPILCTHPWVTQAAVGRGMQKVIGIVPDNFPVAFHITEGSIHAVQSPSAYTSYRTLYNMDKGTHIKNCMPKDAIYETGHFIDHEIVSGIERDCENRLRRITDGHARRFLLTMGGAGAQAGRFADIIRICKGAVETGRLQLFINLGDHKHQWEQLQDSLRRDNIPWTLHSQWDEAQAFIAEAKHSAVPGGVHLFLFEDFFPAVYATNLLMRACDVLITKPSELSYYPVPKLFIQRVGRHEAWGAIRGSEIGDGTIEANSRGALRRTLHCLITDTDLIKLYCRHIVANKSAGIYDGAYNAVKLAQEKIQP